MDPLGFVDAHVRDLRERGLFRPLPVLESPQGPRIRIGGRELINMSSNDYLGLANDPALRKAAKAGAETWGGGAGAVRTIKPSNPKSPHGKAWKPPWFSSRDSPATSARSRLSSGVAT